MTRLGSLREPARSASAREAHRGPLAAAAQARGNLQVALVALESAISLLGGIPGAGNAPCLKSAIDARREARKANELVVQLIELIARIP